VYLFQSEQGEDDSNDHHGGVGQDGRAHRELIEIRIALILVELSIINTRLSGRSALINVGLSEHSPNVGCGA
jgi:hypothetical protein